MLSKLRIVNFRSIVDLTIDFSYAEGKAPNGYKDLDTLPFLTAPNGERLVPCMAFFGANASGKSTIIEAFKKFQMILEKGFREKETTPYMPNKLHPDRTTALFEITFSIEHGKNVYRIGYDRESIIEESLICDGNPIYTISRGNGEFPGIVHNDYSSERLQTIVKIECSDKQDNQNFTLLTTLASKYTQLCTLVTSADAWFQNFICIPTFKIGFVERFSRKLIQEGDEDFEDRLKKRLSELIQRLDMDIKGFSIETDSLSQRRLMSHHADVNGNLVSFDFFRDESDGTRVLFQLLYFLDVVFEIGGVVFADELDCSLHPLLVQAIVKMAKDKRYNTKNAQLIFTTHTTDILEDNLLRVSEISIVSKNIQYGTKTRRLVDMEHDVRNVTNFRKQYLRGDYAGIPFPTI